MKERPDRVGQTIRFCDWLTNQFLTITASLDITSACPERNGTRTAVLLDFAQATEGVVFHLVDCEHGADEGAVIMHLVERLEDLETPGMTDFRSFAENFGLTPEELAVIVKSSAPALDRAKQVQDFRTYSESPDHVFEYTLRKAGLTPADLMR